MPNMGFPSEPHILINGVALNTAQAMTVRVALGNFIIFVQDQLREEPHDMLWRGYASRAAEVNRILHETQEAVSHG
jgi:hypothetical protein